MRRSRPSTSETVPHRHLDPLKHLNHRITRGKPKKSKNVTVNTLILSWNTRDLINMNHSNVTTTRFCILPEIHQLCTYHRQHMLLT